MAFTVTGNRKFTVLIALLALLSLPALPALAATQYITDTLNVGLRDAKGDKYHAIKYLPSGTPVEVLGEEDAYYRVRSREGEEGWIPKKYISPETPKPVIIEKLSAQVGRLKGKLAETVKERDSLKAGLDASKGEAAEKAEELSLVNERHNTLLEQSRDVVEIAEERDRLREENSKLSGMEEFLRDENKRLKRTEMFWWFLAGGGVFFVGWIAGKLSRKKRYY
jgi:SH3 domain protein